MLQCRAWIYGRRDSRPDIDLSRLLMEEKDVVDEDQTNNLHDRGKEAVEDTSSHERLERIGSGAPCCRGSREEDEPKRDGETTEIGDEEDGWFKQDIRHWRRCCLVSGDERSNRRLTNNSTKPKHGYISGLRTVDMIRRHPPFPGFLVNKHDFESFFF